MHRLIIMTTSADVGETFTTLVWHWTSRAEEQLLAYQIILQLRSVCLCVHVCFIKDAPQWKTLHALPVSQYALQLHLQRPALQE